MPGDEKPLVEWPDATTKSRALLQAELAQAVVVADGLASAVQTEITAEEPARCGPRIMGFRR